MTAPVTLALEALSRRYEVALRQGAVFSRSRLKPPDFVPPFAAIARSDHRTLFS